MNNTNCLSLYEVIAAQNPEKAARFLESKGYSSKTNPHIAGAGIDSLSNGPLLMTLADPNQDPRNKQAILSVVGDIATDLQDYCSQGKEDALFETVNALHPDAEVFKEISRRAHDKIKNKGENDYENCCAMDAGWFFYSSDANPTATTTPPPPGANTPSALGGDSLANLNTTKKSTSFFEDHTTLIIGGLLALTAIYLITHHNK